MYHLNFLKVGIATPSIKVGNLEYNANEIITTLNNSKASVVLFPELNLTSLYANDLFLQPSFLDEAKKQAKKIINKTTFKGLFTIGMPLLVNESVLSVVLVVCEKEVIGVVNKTTIPPHQKKYFNIYDQREILDLEYIKLFDKEVRFGSNLIFSHEDIKLMVEIGEDSNNYLPNSALSVFEGVNIVLNPSSDKEMLHSGDEKLQRVLTTSKRLNLAYIYASPSSMESTSENVYAGDMIAAVNGELIDEASNLFDNLDYLEVDIDFNYIIRNRLTSPNHDIISYDNDFVLFNLEKSKDYDFEYLDTLPFFQSDDIFESCNSVNELLIAALTKKLSSLPKHLQKVVIGVTGGADSTLAL